MLRTKTILLAAVLTVGSLALSMIAQVTAQTSGSSLEFPYQALVLRDGASVHSGPGQVHYETQDLKQSAAVEVYRHDPGGWCAIRPLDGSFSLVPESTLKIVEKGVGEISVDGTQAWVGTKLGPVDKPLWQVKLKKGEMVEVVGQISWPDPEGHSTLWYQISPPAGEFRWIRMSDLQLPVSARLAMEKPEPKFPPEAAIKVRSILANDIPAATELATPLRNPIDKTPTAAPKLDSEVRLASMQTDLNAPQDSNRGWRQAKRPIRNRAVANNSSSSSYQRDQYESSRPEMYSGAPGTRSSYGRSPDINYESETQQARVPTDRYADASRSRFDFASGLSAARARSNSTAPSSSTVFNNISAPTILTTHRIDELELLLTREMLREPDQWKLDDLEFRASTISSTTNDPNERILTEKFLKKIENCRSIKFGFKSQPERLGDQPSNSSQPAPFGMAPGFNAGSNIALGTTYDAHGWLNQMVSDGGQGSPSYVLQDANGKITHHVSPIQGMNMHRFLKSHVGIIGQRGYHKRLKLDHVTAHRVVELPKRR